MELALRYNNTIHQVTAAAFIRGKDCIDWLKEISRWNLTVDELESYILPVSLHSVEPAGLFVIFKNAAKLKHLDLLEPYACIGQKLYIPINSELIPELNPVELKTLLLWEQQVFHPTIGFIGFEKGDSISLSDLFIYNEPTDSDWSFAHPGLPARPPFNRIQFEQPSAEELIESIKEEIGQKPLEEIPKKSDEPSAIEKILDDIKFGLLRGIFTIANGIGKILPEGNGSGYGGEGLFQKLNRWLERNIEELSKKRNEELNRLLKLFEEDKNEALQYAIPLNSPYFNRGTGQSSATLSRNPLQFNLRKLGGGQVVDSWDVGEYYNSLRAKYLKAAQQQIEDKDFRKAAYVYAHLLGDYSSAANVLEQGKMYREAAALYKDHLKNNLAAAECLERGTLYNEAIELYKEMNRSEKIGDLYTILKQDKNAETYYEKHIEDKLSYNDFLDAARVIQEKRKQEDRAKQILLRGWDDSYQAELCLRVYFDIVLKEENDNAEKGIKEVFNKHTPKHKRLPFLNVLEYVNKKKDNPEFAATAQDIAYEIAHEEVGEGRLSILNTLKNFLPGDRLIGSDISRYSAANRKKPERLNNPQLIQLDETINWKKATWHRNQFLVLGDKGGVLHMARGNWYGNLEYYAWSDQAENRKHFEFINAPYYSNTILLQMSGGLPVTRKNLPKNKYFNEALVVKCPIWMHKRPGQYIINEEENICRIDSAEGSLTLHHYTIEGELKKSINCVMFDDKERIGSVDMHPYFVNHKGYYYSFTGKQFLVISEEGKVSFVDFNSIIRLFGASNNSLQDFWLVVSTNKGCLLTKPSEGMLQLQGGFFAESLIPTDIVFLTSTRFVITEKKKATLFEIDNFTPRMIREYETDTVIIAALPTNNRNQFGLMEENGKLRLCDTEL